MTRPSDDPVAGAPPRREPISADVPDWAREAKPLWAWMPSRSLLASLRAYQRHAGSRHPVHVALRWGATLRHRFWSVVTGADIPVCAKVGGGLMMPHPNGIVIHPDAQIGPNCLIFQQVTIGVDGRGGTAVIGGHVDLGAGAKILGPVRIGDHARIGANAVVLTDVPAGAVAVGVPAHVRPAPKP